MPPRETITVTQICPVCHEELGTFSEKKENLMLSARDSIWCENCQATVPAIREVSGRRASIEKEVESYPISIELGDLGAVERAVV